MDSSTSNSFNIFQIYSRYCEIRSESPYDCDYGGCRSEGESLIVNFSREALVRLAKLVESTVRTRISLFDELYKLMSGLDLAVDFSEFSRFYDFVFFMCRENGQKNITVSRAVTAWRLVLAGRFRLLNQWCDYVEKNQRHNISEDTWRQVLAFSRCVHEDLGGYDPEGAWPVLIDDFVEHMYRISGSNDRINHNFVCTCGDSEVQSCLFDDPLPGLKTIPGLKRKLCDDFQSDKLNLTDVISPDCTDLMMRFKKHRQAFNGEKLGNSMNDCMELVKHNSPFGSTKSACAVEGCLSKGIAGLFSGRPQLPFGQERRVSYT